MQYDDKDLHKSEEQLAAHIQKIRQMPFGLLDELSVLLDSAEASVKKLHDKPDKTDEEIEQLAQMEKHLHTLLQQVQDMKLIAAEAAIRQAEAYYFSVKQHAEQGNEEAKKIYEDLKESYKEMLKERAGFSELN